MNFLKKNKRGGISTDAIELIDDSQGRSDEPVRTIETPDSSASPQTTEDVYYNENDVIIEMHTFNDDIYEVQKAQSVGIRRYFPDGRVVNVGVVPKGAVIGVLSCSKSSSNHSSPVTYYALHDNVHLKKRAYNTKNDIDKNVCLAILRTITCFCILKDETLISLIDNNKFHRHEQEKGNFITQGEQNIREAKSFIILQGNVENYFGKKLVGTKYEGEIFGEAIFRSINAQTITRTADSKPGRNAGKVVVLEFDVNLFTDTGVPQDEQDTFTQEMRLQINEFDRLNQSKFQYLDYVKLKK